MGDFTDQEQILAAHQKALTFLEVQAASYTPSTIPVHKKIELEEKRAEVDRLKTQLEKDKLTKQNDCPLSQIEFNIPSLRRSQVSDKHYIERDEATKFLEHFSMALKEPTERIDLLRQSRNVLDNNIIYCHPRLARTIFVNLYNILVAMKHYEESLDCYQKAIELDNSDISTFIGQGLAFFNLKRYEDALESFSKAINLDDKSVNAWTNKGATLIDLQRYEEALESSQKAIALDDQSINAWINAGNAL